MHVLQKLKGKIDHVSQPSRGSLSLLLDLRKATGGPVDHRVFAGLSRLQTHWGVHMSTCPKRQTKAPSNPRKSLAQGQKPLDAIQWFSVLGQAPESLQKQRERNLFFLSDKTLLEGNVPVSLIWLRFTADSICFFWRKQGESETTAFPSFSNQVGTKQNSAAQVTVNALNQQLLPHQ